MMRTNLQDTMTCHQHIGMVIELTTVVFCLSCLMNQYTSDISLCPQNVVSSHPKIIIVMSV